MKGLLLCVGNRFHGCVGSLRIQKILMALTNISNVEGIAYEVTRKGHQHKLTNQLKKRGGKREKRKEQKE